MGFLASAAAGAFASPGDLGAFVTFFWSTGGVGAWVLGAGLGASKGFLASVAGAGLASPVGLVTSWVVLAFWPVGDFDSSALVGSVDFFVSAVIGVAFCSLFSGLKFL